MEPDGQMLVVDRVGTRVYSVPPGTFHSAREGVRHSRIHSLPWAGVRSRDSGAGEAGGGVRSDGETEVIK